MIKNREITIGLTIITILFFYIILGIVGVRTIIGAFLVFFLPFYLILDIFNLEKTEKIIFSFFLGIGIYSSVVYYLAILFSSMRIAILVTLILLVIIGILLRRFKKKT